MDIIPSQSSNEDLLCCRACLGTDCKLFNIQEYKLSEAFSGISGTPISKDQLPQYLCTHCRTLLLKCLLFKDMCLRTKQLLERELLKGELNLDCIHRIDCSHRLLSLTLSIVHNIDCVENPHTEAIKKEPFDINNTDKTTIDTAIKCEENMEIDEVNLSETTIDEVNLSETTIDEVNLSETTIDEVNLSETAIDEGNLSETTIDEVNLSETSIDEVNLSETTADEVNLSEKTIDEVDPPHTRWGIADPRPEQIVRTYFSPGMLRVNLGVPNTNVINVGALNTDKAHIGTVAGGTGKRKGDSTKIALVKKKDNVKIKGNIDNFVEDVFVANKMKTVKTYKRNIATVKKKMDIEIQAYSNKVNDELDKNESNIDLDTAMDKAIINVSYKSINTPYASIINDDIGESDIDDINEVKAHMDIVDVDSILKKAVKKTKKCKRNIGITVKKDTKNPKDNSDNADTIVSKPVRQVKKRRKKERKIKYRNKKEKVNIKGDINNVLGDVFVVNKFRTVKTYKRNIATVKKKMDIEIQASDKANDALDKNESNIDLDTAMDEANINVRYKSINTAYANIINDDIGDSDIDDINEVKAHMDIVDVDSILKKGVKKTQKCKRNLVSKPVRQVKKRRKKERKIKYRNPENDYLPEFDFAKFETDFGVKIVTLSKQEQLEEIAARKQSRNYTMARFPCEDCGKGFDMEPAYNNHRRRHSPSAGEHACEICLLRFKLPSLRHRHQDLHKLKFVCDCGFVSRARWTAKLHHEMHKGRIFVCQHCGKGFSKRTSYLSHVRLSHPALNVACGACGETFVSQHGLKMHMSMTHSEIMKPQQLKCSTCSASFVSSDALDRHTDSGEHAGWPCEQCGESCASEQALQAHVGERHPSEPRRCDECRATFSSGAAFETHFRRKHLNERYKPAGPVVRKKPAPDAPRRAPPRGQFVCEQCGHIAPNTALLRYHQNGHLAVKPFPCPQCPKTFATNAARNLHARLHKGEKPHKCPVCSLTFAAKANLNRHHSVVHLGVHANASCHVCARVFTAKHNLRLHINSVHNGQPWPKRERRRKVVKD